ncbi:MAG: endonuclease III [Candidatus Levybacteria bacterium]|nr:endonuclease III [Candidatus Levybacteria bacterium]
MEVDAKFLLELLKKHYPHAKIVLHYGNNFELLTAVILSAQCTDMTVNKVTSKLFPKFRNLKFKMQNAKLRAKIKKITPKIQELINFAQVPIEELAMDIKSTGFYNNKAKNLQAAAKVILEKFHGEVPKTMEELLIIPGVARKTANIVLGNAYGIVEGIAVDTHVKKQAQRFGLSTNTNPDKIEQDLMKRFDKKDWLPLTYMLIEHGRAVRFKKNSLCTVCNGPCELEALAIHEAKK